MAEPQLVVVAGELARDAKSKVAPPQDALAKRWRHAPEPPARRDGQEVIRLLDGWIRRLEREAGGETS